jgi:hypothetical protein
MFNNSASALRGLSLEAVVFSYCGLYKVGLQPCTRCVSEVSDTVCCKAHDPKAFLNELRCEKSCKKKKCTKNFWVTLDVKGKPPYPGFDNIYVSGKYLHSTNRFDITKMVLIQLTISPTSKIQCRNTKAIMAKEYHKFDTAIKYDPRIKLIGNIECYIYEPYVKDLVVREPIDLTDEGPQLAFNFLIDFGANCG